MAKPKRTHTQRGNNRVQSAYPTSESKVLATRLVVPQQPDGIVADIHTTHSRRDKKSNEQDTVRTRAQSKQRTETSKQALTKRTRTQRGSDEISAKTISKKRNEEADELAIAKRTRGNNKDSVKADHKKQSDAKV